ncbi:helix-turn-helix domain-containing protein [Streptomyces sp. NPDC051018]|uniref:AraC-like ligand-binding domain-containing protein n=1 Tax=Streptomyces sp. NPDC051018 TaxID=3365639 RepID=UPI0037BB3E64
MLRTFDTDEVPTGEGASAFAEVTSRFLMPVRILPHDPAGFRARMGYLPLGSGEMIQASCSPVTTERTPRLIRQSDPECYHLVYVRTGRHGIEQARTRSQVGPGEFVLYDSSLPYRGIMGLAPNQENTLVLQFSRRSLRLRCPHVQRLLATPLSGRTGAGRLLAQFLTGLTREYGRCSPGELVRLGQTSLDLVTVALSHCLDRGTDLTGESRQRILFLKIASFVDRHLGDAELSPASIAVAHGISARYVQRLFQAQGTTAGAFIREQRLSPCRRDLADPALRHVPVHAIGARWGLPRASGFNRAFRAAVGMSPGRYRVLAGSTPPPSAHGALPPSPPAHGQFLSRWT